MGIPSGEATLSFFSSFLDGCQILKEKNCSSWSSFFLLTLLHSERSKLYRVAPGRIGHLHTHFIRQSAADLMVVGGLDQVANNYYTLKQGTLLFATVHKLTGLIIVFKAVGARGGWIGQREGFIRLPRGFIGQFFLFENIV